MLWVIVSLLLFGYQFYLTRAAAQASGQVIAAQNNIDEASVTNFIRMRDRFTLSSQVLDKHVMLSRFFDRLEFISVQNARITKLKVTVQENRTALLEVTGVAKNFNALAAESSAFAADKDIKNAIFSGFSLDQKNGQVSFVIEAEIEPGLLTETAAEAVLNAPVPETSQPAETQSATTTP